MPSKPPILFPQQQRIVEAFGERIRLARRRRKWSAEVVATRAAVSRTTLHKAEKGDPSVTLGTYLRILATMGLEKDFELLAADDRVGRRLQDLELEPSHKER